MMKVLKESQLDLLLFTQRQENQALVLTLVSLSSNGTAYHGISSKYSLKLVSSLSELMNTISRFLPFSDCLNLVNHWTSCGVKLRHGGHQWAEKYSPTTLPSPAKLLVCTLESLVKTSFPIRLESADIFVDQCVRLAV